MPEENKETKDKGTKEKETEKKEKPEEEKDDKDEIDSKDNKDENFNWFDDTAEFGFEDGEELTKSLNISHSINKGLIPVLLVVIGVSIVALLILNFIPDKLRIVYGLSLKHIFIILIILSFFLALSKLLVHGLYILIRDHITNSSILHNKNLKLKFIFAIWFFEMIPIGIQLNRYIPWARTVLDRLFIGGFLTVFVLICKHLVVELFREHFILKSLKDKAKQIEIQDRIIEALRMYCYGEEEEVEVSLPGCFLVDFIGDESDTRNDQGINFNKGDADRVVGDLVTNSIFTQSHLTQQEILCLARDVFNKCSKNKKCITFNDFCEIFPNSQTAIQAFLYFDATNDKRLSKKEVRDTLGTFYYNRKNVQTTYNSLNNFVQVIDNLASIVVILPLIFMYFIIFKVSIREIVAFSLSSALLLNFFVSNIAKEFCLNASFILTHPFDIGDDIIIDKKDYTIYRIGLYKTEVLGVDGGKLAILNKVLWTKNIINMTRAPQKLIHVSFTMNQDASKKLFKSLKKGVLLYLRQNRKHFYETFTIQSETETVCSIDKHKCILVVRCKSIENKMSKLELKIELVNHLKKILTEIDAL